VKRPTGAFPGPALILPSRIRSCKGDFVRGGNGASLDVCGERLVQIVAVRMRVVTVHMGVWPTREWVEVRLRVRMDVDEPAEPITVQVQVLVAVAR
jgi:hypothetical protein